MSDFTLNIEERAETGKGAARRLRRTGKIPAIVYKGGEKAIPITIEDRQFVQRATRALSSQVFVLEGNSPAKGKAIVKEIQRDGLKGSVTHVDFVLLEKGRKALVRIPVVVSGEAPGVKQEGGVLTVQCREITALAEPDAIPKELEVSVSELKLGQRIRTGDIELPKGLTLKSSPDETVANVVTSRAAKLSEGEELAAAEAAEGVEGAEGDAPAEGAAEAAPATK